jgi:long-chain acyl-CoA synthetase
LVDDPGRAGAVHPSLGLPKLRSFALPGRCAQARVENARVKHGKMNFLETIFARLATAQDTSLLQELGQGQVFPVTGQELLTRIGRARSFLAARGLKKGERCALLAHNSVAWVAADLAMMAQGLIVVPLYARQAAAERVAMMKDCSPALICCGDAALRDSVAQNWPGAPPLCLLEEMFVSCDDGALAKPQLADADPVTIIYTSGTSGEAKGVVLTAGNVAHVLGCTAERLDALMGGHSAQDRVFHYLPFCFAGSWMMLLTCLWRGSLLSLNRDLSKLSAEMRQAAPNYFLNVPALLERMRKAVDEQLWKTGGPALAIYSRAKRAWMRQQQGRARFFDATWLALAQAMVFPTIRKKMIGSNLKALICGSAPLAPETQLYFMMMDIAVLQVYGLTETTAICTMDEPGQAVPGWVGPAIRGIEMRLGEDQEIMVRGPNIFAGYWNRFPETAQVLRDGWLHTGDQGEVNAAGNWRIIGRIKNLIILASGHNIAPEPIEDELLQNLPQAQQVVLVGNGRSYLSAIVTGSVTREQVQAALQAVNSRLPHYKQVRTFHLQAEAFSIEAGLLTVNGKLKRDLIAARLQHEIEEMYEVTQAS